MTFLYEDKPKKRTVHEIGQDLSLLSADELTARIEILKLEISRLEAEHAAKTKSRFAAESLFKS